MAYRELRKLETALIVDIRRREGQTGMALDVSWEQKLSINQFHGIELNWWPAKIAETAMFLVDHQANRELADQIGIAPERLPITVTAHIHHGNALTFDWNELIGEPAGPVYIFGNPPFIGQWLKTAEQKAEMKRVWGRTTRAILITSPAGTPKASTSTATTTTRVSGRSLPRTPSPKANPSPTFLNPFSAMGGGSNSPTALSHGTPKRQAKQPCTV